MPAAATSVRELFRRKSLLRSSELARHGISRVQVSRMVAAGELQQVSRGLYAAPDYQLDEHAALVMVARRAPQAVFCLLTALRLHDLTTQAPFEVWIAIGNKAHAPRIDYPPLRIVRFSDATLTTGVETVAVGGIKLRVTNAAKTVADCFKFRNKIDVALEALREARRPKKTSNDELWRCAKLCRVGTVMRPYLEALA
jgi:predicted transcriptional regulator of viral defense system